MLQAALQLSTPEPVARATALNGLASIHLALDDYTASLACHQAGLTLRHQLNDAEGIATVLHNMGLTAYMMGDYPQAVTWLNESITADPTSDPMQAWAHLGIIAVDRRDLPQVRYWLERAYEQVMPQPEGWAHAFVMHNLADALRELGELVVAKQMAQSSQHLFEALDDSYYLPDPQLVAGDEGDYATALALSNLALAQYEARQDAALTAAARLVQAEVAFKMGEYPLAAEQFNRAYTLRQRIRRPFTPREQSRYAALEQALATATRLP